MKKVIFILMSLIIVFFMFSCENQPTITEPTQMDEPLSLAKKTVFSFKANADDWFVLSQEPGEYTFAQFDIDGSDDDVIVLPNGRILLRRRELSSPLRQDESGTCNFLNDNIDAVKVTISANLNPDINGPAHGTISITGTIGEQTGTFEGHFTGFFSDERGEDLFEGRLNARGTDGDFIGMKMKGTMLEIQTVEGGNDFILEGNITSH